MAKRDMQCCVQLANLTIVITVHKDRQLELVGWYSLLPSDGPTTTMLPIHEQILSNWNEAAIFLGFHPQKVLNHSVGGKLPLTIYESNYEVDENKTEQDGEDKKMDDGETALKLKFREVPYSVETHEVEMISMNYVAGGGGNASAVTAKDERPSRSIETNKGKRRLVESEREDAKDGTESDAVTLAKEEEEMLSNLTAKVNAIKMLQARIRLLTTYLRRLPPSFTSGESNEAGAMDTDHTVPSWTVLRQIKALVSRLDLVIPSDSEAFDKEMLAESNNVHLVSLLSSIMQSVDQARDVGKKFQVVNSSKQTSKRNTGLHGEHSASGYMGMQDVGGLHLA